MAEVTYNHKNQKSYFKNIKNKLLKKFSLFGVIIFILLALYTLSLLGSCFWAFYTAFKTTLQYVESPLGLPDKWHFENIKTAIEYFYVESGGLQYNLLTMFVYSLLFSGGCSFAAIFTSCITAYATSRFNFKFDKVVYGIVLVTMTLPIVGSLPSELQLLRALNLYDSMIGIWVCKANFLGMNYLIFHATFKGMPKDFSEAAYIDGASNFTVLFKIALPLVKNTFATLFLMMFISLWNDYTTTITYMPSYPTVAYGLFDYNNSFKPEINNLPMKLAGCFVLLTPVLVVFIIFRNKIMGNISMGGVKE